MVLAKTKSSITQANIRIAELESELGDTKAGHNDAIDKAKADVRK